MRCSWWPVLIRRRALLGRSSSTPPTIGPSATDEELARLADAVRANPERWIAQDVVKLSTVPTAANGAIRGLAETLATPAAAAPVASAAPWVSASFGR